MKAEKKEYNIYAGLNGGFGGAHYQYTKEFESEEDALCEAYDVAVEEYESYEGCHGLRDREEVAEEYYESLKETYGDDYVMSDMDWDVVEDIYVEEVESWLDYYVVLRSEDEIPDEDIEVM